jgi:hypothetical protein
LNTTRQKILALDFNGSIERLLPSRSKAIPGSKATGAQFEKLPAADRDEMLFMLAARWADDIRTKDRSQHNDLSILAGIGGIGCWENC